MFCTNVQIQAMIHEKKLPTVSLLNIVTLDCM